jgi:hypothetical protein
MSPGLRFTTSPAGNLQPSQVCGEAGIVMRFLTLFAEDLAHNIIADAFRTVNHLASTICVDFVNVVMQSQVGRSKPLTNREASANLKPWLI